MFSRVFSYWITRRTARLSVQSYKPTDSWPSTDLFLGHFIPQKRRFIVKPLHDPAWIKSPSSTNRRITDKEYTDYKSLSHLMISTYVNFIVLEIWKFRFRGSSAKSENLNRKNLIEGDIGVCGVAVLLSFLCGIPVNKIPHCGVAVISNPTVCDVCAFKPTVFAETKLFAVSRHQ